MIRMKEQHNLSCSSRYRTRDSRFRFRPGILPRVIFCFLNSTSVPKYGQSKDNYLVFPLKLNNISFLFLYTIFFSFSPSALYAKKMIEAFRVVRSHLESSHPPCTLIPAPPSTPAPPPPAPPPPPIQSKLRQRYPPDLDQPTSDACLVIVPCLVQSCPVRSVMMT